MTIDEIEQLETNLIAAKKKAPTRPHPRAPVTGAKVLHPIVGMMDKMTGATTHT